MAAATLSAGGVGQLVHIKQEEFQRMRDEMQLVRRKFKYIQGVSTVFRQKIALILRDLATGPSRDISADEMARAYTRALRELGQLGNELSVSVLGKDEEILGKGPAAPMGASTSTLNNTNSNTMPQDAEAMSFKELLDRMEVLQDGIASSNQRGHTAHDGPKPWEGNASYSLEDRSAAWASNKQAREDIRKAHHLCVLLDEKNTAKAQVGEMQKKLVHLQGQYAALGEKYQRLVQLLQQRGGASGGEAIEREVYEQRIAALEDALVTARTELATSHLHHNGNGKTAKGGPSLDSPRDNGNSAALVVSADLSDPSTAAGGLLSLTNATDVRVLQKQNAVLRARVQSLRQETSLLKERGSGTVEEMQLGMDGLFERVRKLQSDLADRNATIQRLTAEKADKESALIEAEKHVAAYIEQLAHVNTEHQTLSSAYSVLKATAHGEARELSVVVSEYTEMVSQRDAFIKQLQHQLGDAQRSAKEKEVNISVLGAQIESLKSRVEVLMAAEEAKRLQNSSMEDMGDRMLMALGDMQSLYQSGSIAGQLEQLSAKMSDLEGMETQVRIKDDHIAVLQDECDRLRASHHELTLSLNSVTALFSSMPKSATELEALVVELEESRAELARCSNQQCPPDYKRLGQQIDLKLMEARHKKKNALMEQGKKASITRGVANAVQGGARDADKSDAAVRKPLPLPDRGQYAALSTPLDVRHLLGDDDDDDVRFPSTSNAAPNAASNSSLLSIPPPPTLVNITDSIALGGGGGGATNKKTAAAIGGASSPFAKSHAQKTRAAVADAVNTLTDRDGGAVQRPSNTSADQGNANLSSSRKPSASQQSALIEDIHMTFDLFSEPSAAHGGAMMMGGDGLSMAFSTLGLRGADVNRSSAKEMSREHFVAYCASIMGL